MALLLRYNGTMKKLLQLLFVFILSFIVLAPPSFAQEPPPQEFFKAKVLSIKQEGTKDVGGKKNLFQIVVVQSQEGSEKNNTFEIEYGGTVIITKDQLLKTGETVIVNKTSLGQEDIYRITDTFRLPTLLWFIAGFFIVVLLFAGRKGLGSLIGMLLSLGVIMLFIVPQILSGADPLFITIVGALFIMVTTIYLAHGFSQQTTVAVVSTFISLVLTGVLSILFVKLASLSGLGSEDNYNLLQGFGTTINFQGLLLGGIIIGSLGVLDDTTTTQSTTISELAHANPKYTVQELFKRGMIIGREHIASLVNTLVLAYAGAAIGVFIYIHIGLQNNMQPWWVIFNSELLSEEVVRTLAGSIGLILAVPITTLLASFFTKYSIKVK